MARGIAASRTSARRRIMMKVHRSDTEAVQRLLNFMQPGSYAQPHCHPAPEAIETCVALRGACAVLEFDSAGAIVSSHRLTAGDPAVALVDIEAGVWHTVVPLAPDTVVLEIKRGPYDAATDKTFSTWSPSEGSAEAAEYLRQLERTVAG